MQKSAEWGDRAPTGMTRIREKRLPILIFVNSPPVFSAIPNIMSDVSTRYF